MKLSINRRNPRSKSNSHRSAVLEPMERRQLLAVAAMYYNPVYVETESAGAHASGFAVLNQLKAAGHTVRTFDDFTPTTLSAALTGADFIVLPRMQQAVPLSLIPSTAITSIRTFVNGGGGYLQVGNRDSTGDTTSTYTNDEIMSAVFSLPTFGRTAFFGGSSTLQSAATAGTPFVGAETLLDLPLVSVGLTGVTQSATSRSIYRTTAGATTVGAFSYGGRLSVAYLAYDFTKIQGVDTDPTWVDTLRASVNMVKRQTTTPTAPAAPSGLTASVVSTSQINLSWLDNSTNETTFRVDRATNSTFTTGLVVSNVAANVKTLNVTGLTANTTYFFRVVALNGTLASAPTATVSAKTLAPTPTAPAAPTALVASVKSSSQIDLAWNDNANNETGYRVQRATNSTFTTGLISSNIAANSKTFSATALTPNTTYFFRVYAVNGTLLSTASATVSGKTLAVNAPTALTGTPVSVSQINLAWTDTSTNETGFRVQRATNSTFTTGLITTNLAANVKTLNVTGLSANTTYYFRVYAVNGTLLSTASNVVTAKTLAVNTPTSLSAVAASTSRINLAWNDTSTNETGFRVQRATNSTFTTGLISTSVAANVKTLVVNSLAANTTYFFRVYALNGALLSPASNTASAKTFATSPPVGSSPAAPSGLIAVSKSSSRIDLAWKDNATNETGYRIERSSSASGAWTTVATLGAGVTFFSNTGLASATTYYYRVVAILNTTASAPSNTASAKTA
jgi:hypothetical protein